MRNVQEMQTLNRHSEIVHEIQQIIDEIYNKSKSVNLSYHFNSHTTFQFIQLKETIIIAKNNDHEKIKFTKINNDSAHAEASLQQFKARMCEFSEIEIELKKTKEREIEIRTCRNRRI